MRRTIILAVVLVVSAMPVAALKSQQPKPQRTEEPTTVEAEVLKLCGGTLSVSSTFEWYATFWADGSAHAHYAEDARDSINFERGTFDTAAIITGLATRLTRQKPEPSRVELRYTFEISRNRNDVHGPFWACDPTVHADVFELIRQAVRAGRIPNGMTSSHFEETWRCLPPSPLSKPWEAPVLPPGKSRIALSPEPSPTRHDKPCAISPIVLRIRSFGWAGYITENGAAVLGEGDPELGTYLPAGTVNVAAIRDWLKPQLSTDARDSFTLNDYCYLEQTISGRTEMLWFRNAQTTADLFELFRYAYKAQGWRYPRVEHDWRGTRPSLYSRPWDDDIDLRPELLGLFASKPLQTIPLALDPSAKPPQVACVTYYNLGRHESDPLGFLWFVVVRINGEGELRCGVEPQARVVFPPRTFDVSACMARWRAELKWYPYRSKLITEATRDTMGLPYYARFVVRDPTNKEPPIVLWRKWQSEPEPGHLTAVFELVRQACHRQKPKDIDFIAGRWKMYPPTEHTKSWDAPIEPSK